MKTTKIQKSFQGNDIPTENFLDWLRITRDAQKSKLDVDVPCNECRACCTSSYFIHIRPDETETLRHIPKKLLFPAPGLPKGHVVMGYDENGHCPMFKNNTCSIYEHRPQTCRTYDCRIFSATGLHPGNDKPKIAGQAGRWRFDLSEPESVKHLKALRNAAKFIHTFSGYFPEGFVPPNTTQQAVLAIKVYEVFLEYLEFNQSPKDENLIKNTVKSIINFGDNFI